MSLRAAYFIVKTGKGDRSKWTLSPRLRCLEAQRFLDLHSWVESISKVSGLRKAQEGKVGLRYALRMSNLLEQFLPNDDLSDTDRRSCTPLCSKHPAALISKN